MEKVKQKCDYCKEDIDESWLGGDYSILVCSKKVCLDKMVKDHEIKFLKKYEIN
jgi:hypothetical protein